MDTAKTAKPELFWNPSGIQTLLEYIDKECKRKGQNTLASAIGIHSSTFTALRRNRSGLVAPPVPTTMMMIAPHIPDPETGKGFDPWKFVAIGCGYFDGVFPRPNSSRVVVNAKSGDDLAKIKTKIRETNDLKQLAEILQTTTVKITEIQQAQQNAVSLKETPIAHLVRSYIRKNTVDDFVKKSGLPEGLVKNISAGVTPIKPEFLDGIAKGLTTKKIKWTKEILLELNPELNQFKLNVQLNH